MSLRLRIAFASACALLSLLLCVAYADSVRADAARERSEALERYGGERVDLLVATATLEPGDVVSRANVAEREWIADLAPDHAITSFDEVLGNEISVPVAAGVPLTELNFRDQSNIADVPAGHVALSLPITDKLGITRTVGQGTTLAGYAVTSEGTKLVSTSMTVLSSPQTASALAQAAQVTVAVRPEDVTSVLTASATGDLRLVVPADDVSAEEDLNVQQAPTLIDPDTLNDEDSGDVQ